ncbi:hypothetical protein LguiB_035648 [Lonicera macranthoides]
MGGVNNTALYLSATHVPNKQWFSIRESGIWVWSVWGSFDLENTIGIGMDGDSGGVWGVGISPPPLMETKKQGQSRPITELENNGAHNSIDGLGENLSGLGIEDRGGVYQPLLFLWKYLSGLTTSKWPNGSALGLGAPRVESWKLPKHLVANGWSLFREQGLVKVHKSYPGHPVVSKVQSCSEAHKPSSDQGRNLTNSSNGSGISELEQMLKQKSFTRSEIDRLTELLHSRTIEFPARDDGKLTEANHSNPPSNLERHEELSSSPMQENRNGNFIGIPTPAVSTRVLEEDVASPAELAKAYMGSRPSNISPSMLGFRSQTLRDDTTFLNDVSFPSKSPIMSFTSKSAVRVGVPENGFMTPRTRGRSAIYSMIRTPYSRVHPTITQKGARSTNYGFTGPSSSPRAWDLGGQSGTKQLALKRSSSVLDDDIGSVGPIRRIRQKSNLSSQGSPAVKHRSAQKLLLLNESKHKVSNTVEGNGDNSTASTSYAHVPSKSSEMAAKILEHLEKMTPKEKSSESKLLAVRDKSPTKLTPNMLSGQALRSLENVDSSKFMQNTEISHNARLPDARDSSTSHNQDKVEGNGPKKFGHDTSSLNSGTVASVKDGVLNAKTSDSGVSNFALEPPQKKRAFQMSAHEGTLELDDRMHSNGFVYRLPSEGQEGKREKSVVESKVGAAAALELVKTPAFPEVKTPADSVFSKKADLETYGTSVVGGKNTDFTLPSTFQPVDLIQSISAVDKAVPSKDSNASPNMLGSISKTVDNFLPFNFSSSASANIFSSLKSGFQSDPELQSSKSMANVTSGTSEAQLKTVEADNKNTQEAGELKGNSETLPSAASSSTPPSSIFSSPVKISNLNNGSLAPKPSVFPSTGPLAPSFNFSNQMVSNSSALIPSSTSASTITSVATTSATAFSSALSTSTSAPAPSLPSAPIFSFGSSSTPPSTASTTSGVETADKIAKAEAGKISDNVTSLPFSGPSSGIASTGSSIFGFSSAATSSTTANYESQASVFGTGSGSLVSAPPVVASSGTGVATVAQSVPFQFGPSGSFPGFGASGPASFTTSSSLFGSSGPTASGTASFTASASLFSSSSPAAKLFGSGPGFGNSSSTSSVETSSVSSAIGAASSTFGSSWQTNKSPIFGASFNSPSPSPGFSFGMSSSSSVGVTNTRPMVFGSSTGASSGSMFSFTSAATTSSMPAFGNSAAPVISAPSTNGDQMNMEDSMAEDPVQASTSTVPVFGQPVSPPTPGFMFGSAAAPSPSVPSFQFGGQQSQVVAPQNLPPFQASGSVDFNAGGSFSLGSGGGDKSGRRIVRPSKSRNRKK